MPNQFKSVSPETLQAGEKLVFVQLAGLYNSLDTLTNTGGVAELSTLLGQLSSTLSRKAAGQTQVKYTDVGFDLFGVFTGVLQEHLKTLPSSRIVDTAVIQNLQITLKNLEIFFKGFYETTNDYTYPYDASLFSGFEDIVKSMLGDQNFSLKYLDLPNGVSFYKREISEVQAPEVVEATQDSVVLALDADDGLKSSTFEGLSAPQEQFMSAYLSVCNSFRNIVEDSTFDTTNRSNPGKQFLKSIYDIVDAIEIGGGDIFITNIGLLLQLYFMELESRIPDNYNTTERSRYINNETVVLNTELLGHVISNKRYSDILCTKPDGYKTILEASSLFASSGGKIEANTDAEVETNVVDLFGQKKAS